MTMKPDFPAMTDAQSIRFMLQLPWVMGDNSEDGTVSYDAGEIETVIGFVDKLSARAEAAAAERDALRDTLRKVLGILKTGRSTGRNAIKALFAAEDVIMAALDK